MRRKASSKTGGDAHSKSSSKPSAPRPGPKSQRRKQSPVGEDKSDKKVLLEETPTFDTYETRRRARFLMGGLSAACFFLLGWICYRTFLYDPSPINIPVDDALTAQQGAPEPKLSKDSEARFMFKRAQELAKNGQADQAIGMLKKVVKVYKETPTASDAKAALHRSEKNLPLFATHPDRRRRSR